MATWLLTLSGVAASQSIDQPLAVPDGKKVRIVRDREDKYILSIGLDENQDSRECIGRLGMLHSGRRSSIHEHANTVTVIDHGYAIFDTSKQDVLLRPQSLTGAPPGPVAFSASTRAKASFAFLRPGDVIDFGLTSLTLAMAIEPQVEVRSSAPNGSPHPVPETVPASAPLGNDANDDDEDADDDLDNTTIVQDAKIKLGHSPESQVVIYSTAQSAPQVVQETPRAPRTNDLPPAPLDDNSNELDEDETFTPTATNGLQGEPTTNGDANHNDMVIALSKKTPPPKRNYGRNGAKRKAEALDSGSEEAEVAQDPDEEPTMKKPKHSKQKSAAPATRKGQRSSRSEMAVEIPVYEDEVQKPERLESKKDRSSRGKPTKKSQQEVVDKEKSKSPAGFSSEVIDSVPSGRKDRSRGKVSDSLGSPGPVASIPKSKRESKKSKTSNSLALPSTADLVPKNLYDGEAPNVIFSGSKVLDIPANKKFLTDQGAEVTDEVQSKGTTILCVPSGDLKTTTKVLMALVLNLDIVSDKWIMESRKAKHLLDPKDFLIKQITRPKGIARSKLFAGRNVAFTQAVVTFYKESGFHDVSAILRAAGASEVAKKAIRDLKDDSNDIIVGMEKDDPNATALLQKGLRVYKKDLIAKSIMEATLLLDDKDLQLSLPEKAEKVPGEKKRGRRG